MGVTGRVAGACPYAAPVIMARRTRDTIRIENRINENLLLYRNVPFDYLDLAVFRIYQGIGEGRHSFFFGM
jgi:hypothetical protein